MGGTRSSRCKKKRARHAHARSPPPSSASARHQASRRRLGQRKKNEGKLRARAICRLDADDHERYKEAERARKRKRPAALPVLTTAWEQPTLWQLPCESLSRSSEESSSQLASARPSGSSGSAPRARLAVLVCLVHVPCVRSAADTHASRTIACSVIGSMASLRMSCMLVCSVTL